jgi:dipeptidase
MRNKLLSIIIVFAVLFAVNKTNACTNYLITKGASTDGSVMISYAADSHTLYGELYHWTAKKWAEGSMLDVYEWDTGKFLGQIKQAKETYNVVGNVNEYQVAIGETTYGGLEELHHQDGAIMDYGSLIYIGLQRSKTAREAIKIITDLMAEYGYYSEGESFSIADPNEVWILEVIGKGQGEKGAVWVARKIPEGYISGHANQARITTFPQKGKNTISSKNISKIFDPNIENIYSEDVITFARKKGLYKGLDEDFSFSDTYAPVDFSAARFCEIRVWSAFNDVNQEMKNYWEYSKGNIEHNEKLANGHQNVDNYATNRMPLWIKPDRKVSVLDMMHFMRNHLEGTELDMSKDAGAGPFGAPYRWRPLTWEVGEQKYCNERATATQQTGFSFIAQLRSFVKNIGAINWFSVDDASSSVYIPMYTVITKIPETFAVGNGNITEWSETSAFWTFNELCNFAYSRYNLIQPEITIKQAEYEKQFVENTTKIDAEAQKLYLESPQKSIEFLNNYSITQANKVVKEWKTLYHQLFVKYSDGNIKTKAEPKEGYKFVVPNLEQPGYSQDFYNIIIKDAGDKLKVIGGETH